jgi:hypothetical protein
MASTTAALAFDNSSDSTQVIDPPVLRAATLAGRAMRQFEEENTHTRAVEDQGADRLGEKLQVLKDWEGVVDEVGPDYFMARLLDRRGASKVDTEAAKIPFTEVSKDDLPLVKEGAIFYLTVYRVLTPPHGRTTRLFFRRLPAWTPSVLASARTRADRWKKRFGVAESRASS